MLCRLLLVFVSLPLAVSYKCNYLDPVHEKDIHYDYYQISKLMKTIECPQLVKGGTTIVRFLLINYSLTFVRPQP